MFSRRLTIAAISALVLHALAVSLIPRLRTIDAPKEPIIARVTLARIERTPTPPPPPPPVRPAAQTFTASGLHARVEHIKRAGAKRPTPPQIAFATPAPALPSGGQGAGAQNGTDAGSLSAINGNGSGTGSAGTGAGNGHIPCGAIDFESLGMARIDDVTGDYERNNIVATVYYADGSFQKLALDWTWHFKDEDHDPFVNDAVPMLFQFPPAAQRASEPSIVQYIIAHTTSDGRANLRYNCPNIPPAPSASP